MLQLHERDVERLRARAAHCRRLSCGAVPSTVAVQLDRMADEYEREADDLAAKPGTAAA